MMRGTALVLVVLAGCSASAVILDSETLDTGTPDEADTDTDTDTDADTDTGEGECADMETAPAGTVPIDDDCRAEVEDPWDVVLAYSVSAPLTVSGADNSYSSPIVVQLDDDNTDGVIDQSDSPDLVSIAFRWGGPAVLTVLDGATGAEHWSREGMDFYPTTTAADIDADGEPEIVTMDEDEHPIAFEADGTVAWVSDSTPTLHLVQYTQVSVADLEGDGTPEVLVDNLVLEGSTGDLVSTLELVDYVSHRGMAIDDVDLDGDQEIAFANAVFDSDGTRLWAADPEVTGTHWVWPAIVQADGDAEAEILMLGDTLSLWQHDGEAILHVEFSEPTPTTGMPCIGDFDGDGASEVAFSESGLLHAYELDGSRVWSRNIDGAYGLPGCAGFDFDLDGSLELVYADNSAVRIHDGTTGATLWEDTTSHGGYQGSTVPVVADIDGDGAVEIVVENSSDHSAWPDLPFLVVFEHATDGWPGGITAWPTIDYTLHNVGDAGEVPSTPPTSFATSNTLRAGTPGVGAEPGVDLEVQVTEVCVPDCEGHRVLVSAQVLNRGGGHMEDGVELAFHVVQGEDSTLSHTAHLPALRAGTAQDGQVHVLDDLELSGTHLRMVVSRASGATDCDPQDDEVAVDLGCP